MGKEGLEVEKGGRRQEGDSLISNCVSAWGRWGVEGTGKVIHLFQTALKNIANKYTERKKKRRVEFFPSYFNHFLRCLL